MSRRSRPQYRSGLGWILGVAFEDTLTRPVRLAQGFTCVRCCGTPRASSPHDLTATALAAHDGRDCVQLPLARGCYHLAPRRTFTSNPVPMPGTPPVGLRPPFVPPYAAKTANPAGRHLSFAEICPDDRGQLYYFSQPKPTATRRLQPPFGFGLKQNWVTT